MHSRIEHCATEIAARLIKKEKLLLNPKLVQYQVLQVKLDSTCFAVSISKKFQMENFRK